MPRTLLTRRACLAGTVAGAITGLLGGCAWPVRSKVTTFQDWPADAAGARFGFAPLAGVLGELEERTYQDLVAAELRARGLVAAQAGESPRFVIELTPDSDEKTRQVYEAVYETVPVVVPGYYTPQGHYVPPHLRPDPWGPRYVGDRLVTRTVQVSRLRLVIRDLTRRFPGGRQALSVFEARAVIEDDEPELAAMMPYLVRGMFSGFPGVSGQVRQIRFDRQP